MQPPEHKPAPAVAPPSPKTLQAAAAARAAAGAAAGAAAAAADVGGGGSWSDSDSQSYNTGQDGPIEPWHAGLHFPPYSPTSDLLDAPYSPLAHMLPPSPTAAAAAAAAGGDYSPKRAAAAQDRQGFGRPEGHPAAGGYVLAGHGSGGYVPGGYASAGYVPAAGTAPAHGQLQAARTGQAAAAAAGSVRPQQQQQQQQQQESRVSRQSPLMQLLRGGAEPGEQLLMPSVDDLRMLLEKVGVGGLKLLLEPSSFRNLQPQVGSNVHYSRWNVALNRCGNPQYR